jgi:glutathione S-transferase
MTYRLYLSKGSGAFPAAVVLDAAKQPWESVELTLAKNEQHRAEYLAINPMGQVPALLLPDGQIMTESAAMAWYLADRHPEARLLPPRDDPRRATLLRWQVFGSAAIYEDDLRYYYPDRYTTDPAGAPGVKEAGKQAFARHCAMVAKALQPGPFLLGQEMTVVDVYLGMLASWHPGRPKAYEEHPELPRLIAAVKADPRVAPLWQRLGMDD